MPSEFRPPAFYESAKNGIVVGWMWIIYIVTAWNLLSPFYKDLTQGTSKSLLSRFLTHENRPRQVRSLRIDVAFVLAVLALASCLMLSTIIPLTILSIHLKDSGVAMFRWIDGKLVKFAWNVLVYASSVSLYGLLPFGLLHPSSTGFLETLRTLLIFYGLLAILVYGVAMVLGLSLEQVANSMAILNGICTLPLSIFTIQFWAQGTREVTEMIGKRWMPSHVKQSLLDRLQEMDMERVHLQRKLEMHENPPLPQPPQLRKSSSHLLGPWGLQDQEQLSQGLSRLELDHYKISRQLNDATWKKNIRTVIFAVFSALCEISVAWLVFSGVASDCFESIQEYSQGMGIFKRFLRFWVSVGKGILGGLRDQDLSTPVLPSHPSLFLIPIILYYTLCMFYALAHSKLLVALRPKSSGHATQYVMGSLASFLGLAMALPVICDVNNLFSIDDVGMYHDFRLINRRGMRIVYRTLVLLALLHARSPAIRRLLSVFQK